MNINEEYLAKLLDKKIAEAKEILIDGSSAVINFDADELNHIFGEGTISYLSYITVIGFMAHRDLVFRQYFQNYNWCEDDVLKLTKIKIISKILCDRINDSVN